jgi:PAS domain S-box-containing protein
VLVCLLLVLSVLFGESRDADRQWRRRVQELLRALQLHDAQLGRDVLLARAGMLPDYDPLMQDRQHLLGDLQSLAEANAQGLPASVRAMAAVQSGLDSAVRARLADVEHFKSANAVARNSLMYLTHSEAIADADAEMQRLRSVESARLQHALLRYVETLDTDAGTEIKAELDRLASPGAHSSLPILVAHGRLIVDVLPRVDALLRRITSPASTRAAQDFEALLQQADSRAEARAQALRYALVIFCLVLFGYLVRQFFVIRSSAIRLAHSNASLQLEMAERTRAEAELRNSEQRYRAITQFANEAIISVDSAGSIVSWNVGAQAIFGYSAEQAMNTPLAQIMPTRLRGEAGVGFLEWREAEAPGAGQTAVESTGVRSDGTEFALEISRSTWATAQGRFETGIIRDIAERKRLEETARQQELLLIQANKMTALGTLVLGVAHEIDNPNHWIMTNASSLATAWADALEVLDEHAGTHPGYTLGGLPYGEMRDHVPALTRDIVDGSHRIAGIVGNLKDFSRPQLPDPVTSFDINEAVERTVRLLRWLIDQHTDRCSVRLGADLPRVRGDAGQIGQVLVNLLSNALEALPARACAVTVSSGLAPAADQVQVVIEDEGAGISQEHLDRIFDPFFTTKQGRGGTGLGLSISASLVHAHQGSLRYESVAGRGTRVTLSLPCLPMTAPA